MAKLVRGRSSSRAFTATNAEPEGLDAALRMEADRLLGSGLRGVLAEYGQVHLAGSYVLRLMTWRDLDLQIVRRGLDRKAFFGLGGRIAELLTAHRMNYRDETVAATPGLPCGLYWGVYLGDERKGAWKLDVWAVEPGDYEAARLQTDRLLARLTSEKRRQILGIKSQVWSHPEYRRKFSSQDIYDAVLEHDVCDLARFWDFLRKKGVAV